jgi:hypothetical protein
MTFGEFHKKYPHFNTKECIEFYSIFDGHPFLNLLKFDYDLQTSIKLYILDRIEELQSYFIYDENKKFQNDLELVLARIAIGDRKNYSIYEKDNISQLRGRSLFKALFEKNIIKREKSREKPKKLHKKQLIKKSLRRYKIQDKIHFVDNFTRFWFTFIYPYLKNSLHVEDVKKQINQNLDSFISLSFEELSNELLICKLKRENVLNYGSYWDKKIEIDLLIEDKNGTIIAGESKWKNHKICKNILNKLQNKCKKTNLKIDYFALFSKSGFSKELLNQRDSTVLLFDLKDFKGLY